MIVIAAALEIIVACRCWGYCEQRHKQNVKVFAVVGGGGGNILCVKMPNARAMLGETVITVTAHYQTGCTTLAS